MPSPEEILEAARSIRPFLSQLLDPQDAQSVDSQVAALLARAKAGETVDLQLADVLAERDATRQWMREFLESDRESLLRAEKSYQPLPGNPSPIPGLVKYVCPEGDFVWYLSREGEEIPKCPTHDIPLERVE